MIITLSPTNDIIEMPPEAVVPLRVWRGTTERGTEVIALIMVVSPQTHDEEKTAEFAAELIEVTPDAGPQRP